MTDEQINIAIAESMGMNGILHHKRPDHMRQISDQSDYVTTVQDAKGGRIELPNYTADLNACHEFEQTLDGNPSIYNQQDFYTRELGLIVKQGLAECWTIATATARQRCEAYLRTLGKWIK